MLHCTCGARRWPHAGFRIRTDERSLFGDFLLARDRDRFAFAGACVGMRALAADRQALAVPQPAIAAQIHEPLDVHCDLAPLVALDLIVAVGQLPAAPDL